MTPSLLRSTDMPATAWRNGGGSTRELLAWPDTLAWQWRVSVADIERDGPFSDFPGVTRWFTVLQGRGVTLTVDGTEHRLERGSPPLAFRGDAATSCHLIDGPTRDLNLMLRNAQGGLAVAADGQTWSPRAAQCGLFTAVAGHCHFDGQSIAVPAYALLWFTETPVTLSFLAEQRPAVSIGWWLWASPA